MTLTPADIDRLRAALDGGFDEFKRVADEIVAVERREALPSDVIEAVRTTDKVKADIEQVCQITAARSMQLDVVCRHDGRSRKADRELNRRGR